MAREHTRYLKILYIFTILTEVYSTKLNHGYFSRKQDLQSPSDIEEIIEKKPGNRDKLEPMYFQKSNMNNKQISGFDLSEEEMRKFKIWRDGVIPYYIDHQSYNDKALRDLIRNFLSIVNSMTSLNFMELPIPPEDEKTRWVFFINRRAQLGCGDHSVDNFTDTGVQQVILGYDCLNSQGELAQAVLSIAGVPAQHNAPDRDDYIRVYMENIMPEKVHLFQKLKDDEWLFHDLDYDFKSVGHYDSFKYSAKGKAVLEPLNPSHTAGETSEFTYIDILKIRMLYNYIARKKKLNLSECEKLFVKNTNIDDYDNAKPELKPIRKPNKYLGIPENEVPDGDYQEFADEYSQDEEVELQLKSNNTGVVPNDSLDEGNTDAESPPLASADNSLTNGTRGQTHFVYKKKRSKKRDVLSSLSNYKSHEIQKAKLKSKDPLAYLSDYDSGEERYRKDRINRVKGETLKYAKQTNEKLLFAKG